MGTAKSPGIIAATALSAAALAVLWAQDTAPHAPPLRVAAASDLTHAFGEIGQAFEQQTGQRVQFTFGSSGLLATQLTQGAPFDLFAAASHAYAEQAVQAGACLGASMASYAQGRLALWSAAGQGWTPKTLSDLADPRVHHVAIAHPDHAPYGKAAQQALQRAGLWTAVQGKLVLAENVRQALQFAASGNAEVALVAAALVHGDKNNPWQLLDPAGYDPLQQTLVTCTAGQNLGAAQRFAAFVTSAEGQAILARHGFGPGRR